MPAIRAEQLPFRLLTPIDGRSNNDLMRDKQGTPRARKARLTPHDEFYAAIGRFVLEWAGLEFCLDLLLLRTMWRSEDPTRKVKLPHQFTEKLLSSGLK
jgi:hypothetical protein